MDPVLLIIWHSRTGTAEALAAAAAQGGAAGCKMLSAADVEPKDLLAARGYLFIAPENLASMSGAMKEMFDHCYYPVLGKIEGRAYATIIAAGNDGAGAERQIDRIATGWRLRRVTEGLICRTGAQSPEEILAPKSVLAKDLATARELGAAMVEGLRCGLF